MTEEATELASAKDELYALSNKAQLGMQRAEHHDAEAVELTGGWRRAARRSTELRARAAVQAANIEEIENRLTEIDAAADTSERDDEDAGARSGRARAALAEARRELEAAQAELGGPGEHGAREAQRAGAVQRRDDLSARVEASPPRSAAGERLDVLIGEERELRDAI